MKRLFLLTLCIFLCSCAARSPEKGLPASADRWQEMIIASARADKPYRIQLSMRYGEEGNTRRVTGVLWGNPQDGLRLDIMAGVGAILAKIKETEDSFLLVAPRENRAYYHTGSSRPLLKIGVPVPFDLMQLSDLLCGRFTQVFGKDYLDATPDNKGQMAYVLADPPGGTLVLDQNGVPVSWVQKSGGWSLTIQYDETEPFAPKTLRLANSHGKQAVILVKGRESIPEPFPVDVLDLAIPPGMPKLPLNEYIPK